MGQRATMVTDGVFFNYDVPSRANTLPSGLKRGECNIPKTSAFWRVQCWLDSMNGMTARPRLGETLAEELTACTEEITGLLRIPLNIGEKTVTYQFPKTRGRVIDEDPI